MDALREPPKSKFGSMASNSQCRSDSGTPSRMQIICIGSSAATSTTKSNGVARHDRIQQPPRPRPQIVLDPRDHPRRQARTDQPADLRVTGVVHHVEHLTGDGQVLQQRPAERPRAAGHRRDTSADHETPQGFPRTSRPTRSPRRRGCSRSARASTPAPRDDAARTASAGNPRRSCPDR